jgi:hypothetical protein
VMFHALQILASGLTARDNHPCSRLNRVPLPSSAEFNTAKEVHLSGLGRVDKSVDAGIVN